MPKFKQILKWGSIFVLLGVSSCAVSTGRSKAFLNPIMRPILLAENNWKTFITLEKRQFKEGSEKKDVEKYILRKGFERTEAQFYQAKLCQWLGAEHGDNLIGKPHLTRALDECRAAKMDIVRQYSNRNSWRGEDGKPIYKVIVSDVYHQRHGEFPCTMDYSVISFYDHNEKLIETLGYRTEAGCL